MESTEATAMSHKDTEVDPLFPYYNAKEMVEYKENDTVFPTFRPYDFFENPPVTEYVPPKAIVLKEHPHFFNMSVNTSLSSVHVPENVFDRGGFMKILFLYKLNKYLTFFSQSLKY